MQINQLTCAISGHRENKLPYKYGSDGYKELIITIEEQVMNLIHSGVVHWIGGLQNGIDADVSMAVLKQRDIIGTTEYLHLVLPFKGMEKSFNSRQMKVFDYLIKNAKSMTTIYDHYVDGCYRERNQILIDRSDLLLAVQMKNAQQSGTKMTISMARRKGIEIRIIDPVSHEVEIIPARKPVNAII